MSDLVKDFKRGIIKENPVLRLVLGMCPTLAVTTEAVNGIGMGLATLFVLLGSNTVVSTMRNVIPKRVRIPVYIVTIATFVTIVDLLLKAYFFNLHKVLGLFIPLIVVNCIILGRAEAFGSRRPVINSIADALGMGLGFTMTLVILGGIREILGNGTIFGFSLFGSGYVPFLLMILPPGAFIVLGFMMWITNILHKAH